MRNPGDLDINEVDGLIRDCQAVLDRQYSEAHTVCSIVGLVVELGLHAAIGTRLARALLGDVQSCIPYVVVEALASESRVDVVF